MLASGKRNALFRTDGKCTQENNIPRFPRPNDVSRKPLSQGFQGSRLFVYGVFFVPKEGLSKYPQALSGEYCVSFGFAAKGSFTVAYDGRPLLESPCNTVKEPLWQYRKDFLAF
jgi:hypothetical protein